MYIEQTSTSPLAGMGSAVVGAMPYGDTAESSMLEPFVRGLIQDVLGRHGDNDVPASMLRPTQDFMDTEWELFCRRHPGPYMLGEGCAVSGLQAGLHNGRLMFRWRTSFYPRPRYPSPEVDIYPLGFHGEYDLYIAFHESWPPEAVCRHGGGDKAARWTLVLPLEGAPEAYDALLREVLERANRGNALWGSAHAVPAPLGSIAVPWKKVPGQTQ